LHAEVNYLDRQKQNTALWPQILSRRYMETGWLSIKHISLGKGREIAFRTV